MFQRIKNWFLRLDISSKLDKLTEFISKVSAILTLVNERLDKMQKVIEFLQSQVEINNRQVRAYENSISQQLDYIKTLQNENSELKAKLKKSNDMLFESKVNEVEKKEVKVEVKTKNKPKSNNK